MDYSQLVPSREICERLRDAGICQNNPELWYCRDSYSTEWNIESYIPICEHIIIAPTLPRLMADLPHFFVVGHSPISGWYVDDNNNHVCVSEDSESVCNAVALALLEIKKGE